MSNSRLLIKKEGISKYLSHLDLMHTMERVFNRAGIKIWHTQGFNPHPYMAFALPLSVGVESVCELMDFVVEDDSVLVGLPEKLNQFFPTGITVLDAYTAETKLKDIVWLEVNGELVYDDGSAKEKLPLLKELYKQSEIIIERRTKRGFGSTDIAPNIRSLTLEVKRDTALNLHAVIAAQNPSLNPEHLITAIKQLTPELTPDFHSFRRIQVYDKKMQVFR